MSRTQRRSSEAAGRRAETIAAWYLRAKGYRILGQRFKTPVGEIDLIAKRGNTVVFCEVKRRRSERAAREAITAQQRQRITRAAHAFLAKNPAFLNCEQRVDALLLVPRRWPVHIHNISGA